MANVGNRKWLSNWTAYALLASIITLPKQLHYTTQFVLKQLSCKLNMSHNHGSHSVTPQNSRKFPGSKTIFPRCFCNQATFEFLEKQQVLQPESTKTNTKHKTTCTFTPNTDTFKQIIIPVLSRNKSHNCHDFQGQQRFFRMFHGLKI